MFIASQNFAPCDDKIESEEYIKNFRDSKLQY